MKNAPLSLHRLVHLLRIIEQLKIKCCVTSMLLSNVLLICGANEYGITIIIVVAVVVIIIILNGDMTRSCNLWLQEWASSNNATGSCHECKIMWHVWKYNF